MRILISGAAGNLGSFLARRLLGRHELRLLIHKQSLPLDLATAPGVSIFSGDLRDPASLVAACDGVDCVVHLAGVLFAPQPARFLPITNVQFVRNLATAAQAGGARRFILLSFPHVEGETTPEKPATHRLDRRSEVIHFRTRLEAERLLLEIASASAMTPIILRAGVVYGKGVKLTEAARRLLRWRLMAVWRRPTWVHLIALPDLLAAMQAAIEKPEVSGIYNICDDEPLTLQAYLDATAAHLGYPRPWRFPEPVFHAAGFACELLARLLGTAAPLTPDIIKAGMTSSVADTSRMKRELLATLNFPTYREGMRLL